MAVSKSRRTRGRATELLVADYFKELYPNAQAVNSGASGSDVINTPFDIEVKARASFNPLAWLKQGANRESIKLRFVVMRCNGQGDNVDDYVFIARLGDMKPLLEEQKSPDSVVRCKCGQWIIEGADCWVCSTLEEMGKI